MPHKRKREKAIAREELTRERRITTNVGLLLDNNLVAPLHHQYEAIDRLFTVGAIFSKAASLAGPSGSTTNSFSTQSRTTTTGNTTDGSDHASTTISGNGTCSAELGEPSTSHSVESSRSDAFLASPVSPAGEDREYGIRPFNGVEPNH